MPYKKKATPGSIQFNKLIDQLPEKREKIKAQLDFKDIVLESQKRNSYKNEFDRLQGGKKKLPGLDANTIKNARTTEESKATTQRRTISSYLFY